MKKIIALIGVLVFVSSIASAELLKNFKYDGSIEVNAYQTRNAADFNGTTPDKVNDAQTRIVLGAGFDLNDDVNTRVTVAKIDDPYGVQASTIVVGLKVDNVETETVNQFAFYEGYLNIKGLMGFDHKLGRQLYGQPGDLIVYYGPLTWPYPVGLGLTTIAALDGYSGYWKNEKWDIHGVLGKNANNNTLGGADRDKDVFGLMAKYDMRDDVKLTGFIYRLNSQTGGQGPNDHLDIIGAKANGNYRGIDYSVELAKNMGRNNHYAVNTDFAGTGKDNKYQGMGYKVNVQYSWDIASKLIVSGEFASGSGDKKDNDDKVEAFMGIQSDYRPGILWGGYGVKGTQPRVGITNLTTWNLGAEYVFTKPEKLSLSAKYYNFAPTEKIGTVDKYGNEFDLTATWKHSDHVSFNAYYAQFTPEKDWTGTDDPASILGTSFMIKF